MSEHFWPEPTRKVWREAAGYFADWMALICGVWAMRLHHFAWRKTRDPDIHRRMMGLVEAYGKPLERER